LKPYQSFLAFALLLSCATEPPQDPSIFLPDDLKAVLWAESPLFFNPTNMDVDMRGRIWVTEAVNYRNFNNDSTKVKHHAAGDRVMILEDTDNDGKADKSTVFVQDKDLVSPLGIAVIGNKIIVSCSPNLIVYTDNDGDDKPDSKEILLTGFGGLDHDHSLHSVVAGADGNYYFNTGNAGPHIVTDKSGWTLRSGSIYTGGTPYNLENKGNMKSDDGRTWVGGLALRMKPDGSGLKVMAHNFRNSYEVAIDSHGNLWQNDNDDQVVACRVTWVMEGGNAGFFSNDGTRYWQGDQRPWQDVFTAHWHQQDPGTMPAGDKSGAGSPTGVAMHEGDELGAHYRGLLLSADAGRNVVFGYQPKIKSSGYDLGTRKNFITSLTDDNKGYVWSDSLENAKSQKWFRPSDVMVGTDGAIYVADWHDPVVGGHQMQDSIGYGRIYRISPKGKKLKTPSIDLSTIEGQIEALKNPAINVRNQAFEKLKVQGDAVADDVKKLLSDSNPYIQARAIWLLAQSGAKGKQTVESLLDNADEMMRAAAFRALRNVEQDILPYAEKLTNDKSAFVRREVLIALRDVPFEKSKSLWMDLVKGYDGEDRWYLEALGAVAEGYEDELYPEVKKLLGDGKQAEAWDKKLSSLMWRLHPSLAVDDFRKRVLSNSLSDEEHSASLTALAFINTKRAAEAMLSLSKSENKLVNEQATYWLAFRQSNDWFDLLDWRRVGIDTWRERILAEMKVRKIKILDAELPFNEKMWNAQDMARDAVGGQMLIGMAADNSLPKELFPEIGNVIFDNPDLAVRVQASTYFKKTGAGKTFSIKNILALNSDAVTGEKIFNANCATCHKVKGKGMDVGPDLTLIKNKFDKQGLLDAIVNPNAGVLLGYEQWLINTKSGETFFGIIVSESEKATVIKDLTGKRVTIETGTIALKKKQNGSIMPEPSSSNLSEQDLADVVGWLVGMR
jgi:putative membrane-bound dehydrogenase-like protein